MAEAGAISKSSKPGVPEHLMHKNRLQQFTQKSAIPLPVYQTMNEGSPHSPRFRATVLVDGVPYVSAETFSHIKEAEQAVAKYALEHILGRIKNEGVQLLSKDTIFCKSILNEYVVKMNLQKPSYETTKSEGPIPLFVSSLSFNGKLYTGIAGRNKKEAEQLAARAVIQSILGESNMVTCLSEIIKSKAKLYAAMHKINDSGTSTSIRKVGVLPGTDQFPMAAYAGTCQEPRGTFPVPISEPHGQEPKQARPEPVSETITGSLLTSLPVPQTHRPHPNQKQNEVPLEQHNFIVGGISQGTVLQMPAYAGTCQGQQGVSLAPVSEPHDRELKKQRVESLVETTTHQPHPNRVLNEVPLEQHAVIVGGSSPGAVAAQIQVPLGQPSAVGDSSQAAVCTNDAVTTAKSSWRKNKRRRQSILK